MFNVIFIFGNLFMFLLFWVTFIVLLISGQRIGEKLGRREAHVQCGAAAGLLALVLAISSFVRGKEILQAFRLAAFVEIILFAICYWAILLQNKFWPSGGFARQGTIAAGIAWILWLAMAVTLGTRASSMILSGMI